MNRSKFIRILIIILLLFVLSGCSEFGEKRIVKLITIDKQNISLYYYDYSQEKPAYIVEKVNNNGISDSLTELLAENSYDLKLCQYAVCSEDIIKEEINEVFYALMNCKFSPYISLIVGDTKENSTKYIEYPTGKHPLYTYSINNNKISGIVEVPDENEKIIIVDNHADNVFSRNKSFVFDLLTGKIKEGIYCFEKDEKTYSANLEKLSVFYSADKDVLNINISGIIQEYKGLPAGSDAKESFKNLIIHDIQKQITELFLNSDESSLIYTNYYKNYLHLENIKTEIFLE